MKYEEAKHILLLNDDFCENDLKKQYRTLALTYHPDKNLNSDESKLRFQEINDAYLYLNKINNFNFKTNTSYKEILIEYLKNHFDIEDRFTINFILNLLENCQRVSLSILEKLPKNEYLHYILIWLRQNKTILHLDDKFMEDLNHIYNKIQNKKQIVYIFPEFGDLFEQNIIKLVHKKQVYYVPAWTKQIIFDIDKNEQTELIVNVYPNLPKNINLDSQNNIIYELNIDIKTLLSLEFLPILICKTTINIPVNDIKIINKQKFYFKKQGIPRIDENNSYNNENISDIIIYLNLY